MEALGVAMYPDEEKFYPDESRRAARDELTPEKAQEEPVIPTAPTRADMESIALERERAHSAVQQEWETIKKFYQ